MPAAEPDPRRRVVIEFEPGGSPVSGVVCVPGWAPRRFSGWLELIASLEGTATMQDHRAMPLQETATNTGTRKHGAAMSDQGRLGRNHD